jgi:hypothetical protein
MVDQENVFYKHFEFDQLFPLNYMHVIRKQLIKFEMFIKNIFLINHSNSMFSRILLTFFIKEIDFYLRF